MAANFWVAFIVTHWPPGTRYLVQNCKGLNENGWCVKLLNGLNFGCCSCSQSFGIDWRGTRRWSRTLCPMERTMLQFARLITTATRPERVSPKSRWMYSKIAPVSSCLWTWVWISSNLYRPTSFQLFQLSRFWISQKTVSSLCRTESGAAAYWPLLMFRTIFSKDYQRTLRMSIRVSESSTFPIILWKSSRNALFRQHLRSFTLAASVYVNSPLTLGRWETWLHWNWVKTNWGVFHLLLRISLVLLTWICPEFVGSKQTIRRCCLHRVRLTISWTKIRAQQPLRKRFLQFRQYFLLKFSS